MCILNCGIKKGKKAEWMNGWEWSIVNFNMFKKRIEDKREVWEILKGREKKEKKKNYDH